MKRQPGFKNSIIDLNNSLKEKLKSKDKCPVAKEELDYLIQRSVDIVKQAEEKFEMTYEAER